MVVDWHVEVYEEASRAWRWRIKRSDDDALVAESLRPKPNAEEAVSDFNAFCVSMRSTTLRIVVRR